MDIVGQTLKSEAAKGTEALQELASTLAGLAHGGADSRGVDM